MFIKQLYIGEKNDNLIIIKYNDIVDKNIINKYNNIHNCTNNDYNIKELTCLINMLISKNFSIYSILICDIKYKFEVYSNNNYPSISTVYFDDLIFYDNILYIARTNNDKKYVKRILKIKKIC